MERLEHHWLGLKKVPETSGETFYPWRLKMEQESVLDLETGHGFPLEMLVWRMRHSAELMGHETCDEERA